MKRLAIFIGGLLVLPAFAEVAPIIYDDIEYMDVAYDEYGNPVFYTDYEDTDLAPETDDTVTIPSVSTSRGVSGTRTNANRTTIGRTVPTFNAGAASGRASAANSSRAVAARTTTNTSPRSNSNSRAVASRGTASRTTSTTATRTATDAATRAAATRATGGAGRTATSTRTGASGGATVARTTTSRNATSSRTATTGARVNRASTNAAVALTGNAIAAAPIRLNSTSVTTNKTVLGSDGTLYIPNGAASRVSVANRVPTIRMSSMYCNVLDDNQGRCSCSANIKNYAKAEAALKQATEELQEVAQKIQYIGLSAREVETLFTATEAELKMQTTTDTTQLKASLDKIKDMIIEVQSGTASSSNSSFLSFDLSGLLDFTIDSTGFDLSSFLGGFGTNANGINNQRGEELFKTATNRCKANVLKACTAQGVDGSLITNAYDLEIDKECIAYERSLNDSNDQMVATVRNAKSVLQKARLLVEQSKNEYDMRGCINALDSCMQDEYVCGSDYEKCLDPSGRYIVNGEIVIGTDPGRAVNGINDGSAGVLNGDICSMNLYNVWNYGSSTPGQTNSSQSGCKNAWNSYSLNGSGNGDLADYINQTVTSTAAKNGGLGMSEFIQNKIGWNDGDKNYGMCISVLNKCQDYTYTGKGSSRKYNPVNEVIKQYLDRTLIQIKARQDEILAEHAESCITDVTTCLSQNNYPFEETADNVVQANIAINACRSTVVTCMSVNGYSVANPTPSDLSSWICGITTGSPDCIPNSGGGVTPTPSGTYTVTYNCNGGSGTAPESQTASYNAYFTPRNNRCTAPSNKQFNGWAVNGPSASLVWLAGRSYTYPYQHDITLYARWADTPSGSCTPTTLQYCLEGTCAQLGGDYIWCETGLSRPSCTLRIDCPGTCSYTNLSACTSGDCGIYGGQWCAAGITTNFSCGATATGCCLSNVDICTRDQCTALNKKWCVQRSGDDPRCTLTSQQRECCVGSVAGCQSQPDCTAVGGTWNGSSCTSGSNDGQHSFGNQTFEGVRAVTTGDGNTITVPHN